MAGLEALVFFLVVPLIASVGAIAAGWSAYANLRSRADSENPGPESLGRFLVYPAILATPVVFGLVLWILTLPITAAMDSPAGMGAALAGPLLFDAGEMFAIVAVVQVVAQAWIARARMAQFFTEDFARVQTLLVIPETTTVFALTLVFLVLGHIEDMVTGLSFPTAVSLDSVIFSLGLYEVGSISVLLGAALSNQVEDLKGRGLVRALLRQEIGVVVPILLLAGALLALSNL